MKFIAVPQNGKSITANTVIVGLDHGQGDRCCDGCVDGVAALFIAWIPAWVASG